MWEILSAGIDAKTIYQRIPTLQTPSFDSLAIELLKHGYHKISYREVSCLRHGTWRIAYDAHSLHAIGVPACPCCQKTVPCSGILADGYSKRETPFFERIKAPLHSGALAWMLTQVDDDDERDRRRIRREQARGKQRATHYRKEIPESHFADNPRYA